MLLLFQQPVTQVTWQTFSTVLISVDVLANEAVGSCWVRAAAVNCLQRLLSKAILCRYNLSVSCCKQLTNAITHCDALVLCATGWDWFEAVSCQSSIGQAAL